LAADGSGVVEQMNHDPKFGGSNPPGRDKNPYVEKTCWDESISSKEIELVFLEPGFIVYDNK